MRRITRDFITLFNVLWYKDFPLAKQHKETGSRAEWTTHIGICARTAADLMGYFTYFEHGNRTDAVIKDNQGGVIANLEWEWKEPRFIEKVNEIRQLHDAREDCKFSVFVAYSDTRHYESNIKAIEDQWGDAPQPLTVIIILFDRQGKKRVFRKMETHHLQNGVRKKIRSQPALPWQACGKRWENWGSD